MTHHSRAQNVISSDSRTISPNSHNFIISYSVGANIWPPLSEKRSLGALAVVVDVSHSAERLSHILLALPAVRSPREPAVVAVVELRCDSLAPNIPGGALLQSLRALSARFGGRCHRGPATECPPNILLPLLVLSSFL